jgi:hypothetical protein
MGCDLHLPFSYAGIGQTWPVYRPICQRRHVVGGSSLYKVRLAPHRSNL